MTNRQNAFNWDDGTPSIFAGDSAFAARGKLGLSNSHYTSLSCAAYTSKTGKSRGTIVGISNKADAAIKPVHRFANTQLVPKESTSAAMARRDKARKASI